MAGLLTATQAPTPAPTQAPQASLAAPSFYGSRDATASLADSTGYDASKQNVSGNSLVQNQISGILAKGSPLQSQAEAYGNRSSARRGLLNSSIAVGAAEDAMLKSALPIAQQDASTYGTKDVNDTAYENRAREFTAGAKNTASLTNAQLGTQVNLSNSAESNKAAAQNAAIASDVSKFNAGSQTDMTKLGVQGNQALAQISAQGGVQKELANIQSNTQMTLADKQIAANAALAKDDNALKMQLAKIQSDTTLTAAEKQNASQQLIAERNNNVNLAISGNDNATKQLLQSMDAASKLSLANIDAGTKLAVAGLDVASKEKLTKIESDNRQLLQTNINAANMYAQYVTNLANISTSDKMDAAAKQAAADNQLAAFNAALRAVGHISGLDLSQYFQSATPVIPQTTTPTPEVNVPAFDYNSGG